MNSEDLRQLFELAEKREQTRYAFLRQLLVLSSGALAALVAFRGPDHSTGPALWALRTAWVALGLGILSGAAALHGEVWLIADLARQAGAQAKTRMSSGGGPPVPIVSNLPRRYAAFARICYTSLLVAVIALVAYALARG